MGRRRDGGCQEVEGEKLEECGKEQGQLTETSKEDLGSKRAVVPMMMMMIIILTYISNISNIYKKFLRFRTDTKNNNTIRFGRKLLLSSGDHLKKETVYSRNIMYCLSTR